MKRISFLLLLFLLVSCASITRYEPKSDNDSLVIGKIKMENRNFITSGSVSVNGTYTGNIEISIVNMTTGEIIKTKTDKNGLFMFYNLSTSDNYQIIKIYFKKEEGKAWADVWVNTTKYMFIPTYNSIKDIGYYIVKTDKINNIWDINRIEGTVFDDFVNIYKDSKWVNKNIVSD